MKYTYIFLVLYFSIYIQAHLFSSELKSYGSPECNVYLRNICGSSAINFQIQQITDKKLDSTIDITFSKWGDKESDISIIPLSSTDSASTFELRGSTGNSTESFISTDLNYADSPIRLNITSADKLSGGPISFVFKVIGNDSDPRYLRFVNGPLFMTGWKDNSYFENISSNSSKLISFDQILKDHGEYTYLDGIIIVIQKHSTINSITFSLNL